SGATFQCDGNIPVGVSGGDESIVSVESGAHFLSERLSIGTGDKNRKGPKFTVTGAQTELVTGETTVGYGYDYVPETGPIERYDSGRLTITHSGHAEVGLLKAASGRLENFNLLEVTDGGVIEGWRVHFGLADVAFTQGHATVLIDGASSITLSALPS